MTPNRWAEDLVGESSILGPGLCRMHVRKGKTGKSSKVAPVDLVLHKG